MESLSAPLVFPSTIWMMFTLTDCRSTVPRCFQWWAGVLQGAGSGPGQDSHRKGHERIWGRGEAEALGTWRAGSCWSVWVPARRKFSRRPQPFFVFPVISSKLLTDACSLLQEMQKCFDEKDIQMLQDVISKMDPTVGSLGKVYKISLFLCSCSRYELISKKGQERYFSYLCFLSFFVLFFCM